MLAEQGRRQVVAQRPGAETDRVPDQIDLALALSDRDPRREPELLHNAPISAPVRRLDEVRAARDLVLSWTRPTRPAED